MSFIHVSSAKAEDILQLKVAILTILEAKADQKTIQMALKILEKGVMAPSDISISNCTFTNKQDER